MSSLLKERLGFNWIICVFFSFSCTFLLSSEENFILIDGRTNKVLKEIGPHIDEQYSPCCSFNIALSLMGFDTGILKNESSPVWKLPDGYDGSSQSWETTQSPMSWMKYSCVWYSKLLSSQLGRTILKNYLIKFDYGNQNLSGILISPREQVHFIQKMVLRQLPISSSAIEKTKILLFKEDLLNRWKLFGKTGLGSTITKDGKRIEHAWFVGWIEKSNQFLPFAYLIRSEKINPDQRIPRVKQLILEALGV